MIVTSHDSRERRSFGVADALLVWHGAVLMRCADDVTMYFYDCDSPITYTCDSNAMRWCACNKCYIKSNKPMLFRYIFFVEGSLSEDSLFIAMAGTHQIWLYALQDSKWGDGV